MTKQIKIRGAKTHNLQNIDINIPKDKLIVITGLSGSGKSSLAFDTIYAEGQRKYVESLSSYARQFLGLMDKPDVETITGLSPAISIDQKSSSHNPRSTVGTITEVYDYLRLLFARIGHPRSPKTGARLQKQTVQQIVDTILEYNNKLNVEKLKLMVLAPVIKNRKGTYEELFNRFLGQGYVRARVDGQTYNLEEDIKLDRYKKHNIEIIIDRLILKNDSNENNNFIKRLTDSVETALNLGDQELLITVNPEKKLKTSTKEKINAKSLKQNLNWYDIFFSEKYVDPTTGESFPEIEPHTFSFNSPHGACQKCSGLGYIQEIEPELIYNPDLSISEGGVFPWARLADNMNSWTMSIVKAVAKKYNFSLRVPLKELEKNNLDKILYGCGNEKFTVQHRNSHGEDGKYTPKFEGVIPNLKRRYKETDSDYIRKEIEKYMRKKTCSKCSGLRLKKHALSVTINGVNIVDVTNMSIENAKKWVEQIQQKKTNNRKFKSTLQTYFEFNKIKPKDDVLTDQELKIAKQIFQELDSRLEFLLAVGLDYLTLSRTAKTLSGGESQRIRLASQIGTGLTGVLYILDEPSIGLHQRDNERLLNTLKNLRDIGNTVIIVEHDEDTIRNADHIVDLGPGAGEHGGQIVAQGEIEEILNADKSITGSYLSGKKQITKNQILKDVENFVPEFELDEEKSSDNKTMCIDGVEMEYKENKSHCLNLMGVEHNNLKKIDVQIPLGNFVCVTGVSGSGKSSLINETLYPIFARKLYQSKIYPGAYKELKGIEKIDKVVNIDQSPIGRTPRSNPATYTQVFTPIRELFAETKEAKARGYKKGRFSFNVKGGRCENCGGDGLIKIEMQFLPDVYVTCDVCKGKRYNRETLQIDYKGKTIADILEMTVEQASKFFEKIPKIHRRLKTLKDVGLAYLKLGQSATTLSGGEAQRIKLAKELSKRSTSQTLYILDEPTTGLHFEDVRKLLIVLHSLVAKDNTVVVIEHNMDVIKTADWIIDLGPEGGDRGGEVVATGTPDKVAKVKQSYTGQWLKKIL
ncbi:excinuclease ABC subunit A [Candidatus Dojkabacteria bacterium]|nr:excinuclease ABC subunit A [Candidatus Dojkabacteria bacterium]